MTVIEREKTCHKRETLVIFTQNVNTLPVQFVDRLYYLLGTLRVLVGHRDSCPSGQIFYPLAFVVCFHLPLGVFDPRKYLLR